MPSNWKNRTDACPAGLLIPIMDESGWNPVIRGIAYFIALMYSFVGVSVVTDIFMSAIIIITSHTRRVYLAKPQLRMFQTESGESVVPGAAAEPEFVEVRLWNDTVANLTLMALGTSAPEIMLACVEIVGHKFQAGELGPGTIVGSAAFNLLIITAVCMVSIPRGETRRIQQFRVFWVCSACSVFAYVWLWIILTVVSPQVVDLWEAIVTFLMFPTLVLIAYGTDKGCCGKRRFGTIDTWHLKRKHQESEESENELLERKLLRNGVVDREKLVAFVKEVKRYPDMTDEDVALLAACKILDSQRQSSVHYRIDAVRNMTGGRRLRPVLTEKLQEVYDTINRRSLSPVAGYESPDGEAIVEFHATSCAVRENIGSFHVIVWRHGNLEPEVHVRVESVDGSAKEEKDYEKVDEVVTFKSGETIKEVLVRIVDDNQWEPDEEFFLKLSLVRPSQANVRIGRISIMEIVILDDDKPSVIAFEKRGVLVKETSEFVVLNVRRKFGADGEVSVKWRTIDETATSGLSFIGGEGELVFKHREVLKTIEIPIINELRSNKDDRFQVELFSPSNNASLGNINRICVTITSDEALADIIDSLMARTSANVDSLAVSRKTWGDQMKDAMNVNGGDLENAKWTDYVLHFLSFNWKIMFSLFPPPHLLGGWLSFFLSLIGIGVLSAVIGDLANIFGCIVGLGTSTTAITLVALGTSLPDTFASRSAALWEDTADTAVGNVMGSNSVNVFLGLGLPWLIATIYHCTQGTVFLMPAGTLGFSVLLFSCTAFIAFSLLLMRRNLTIAGKAELGGPLVPKIISGGILVLLWSTYVLLSSLYDYGYIQVHF